MTSGCERYREDWDALAAGALEPSEDHDLLDHLRSGCKVCQERYSESVAVLTAIGASVPEVELPAGAEKRLLARLARTDTKTTTAPVTPPPIRPRPVLLPWAAVAAAIAVVAWLAWDRNRLSDEINRSAERITDLSQRLALAEAREPPPPAPRPTQPEFPPPVESPPPSVLTVRDTAEEERLRDELNQLRELLDSAREARRDAESEVSNLETGLAQSEARARDLETKFTAAQSDSVPRPDEGNSNEELARLREDLASARGSAERRRRLVEDYQEAFRILESGRFQHADLAAVNSRAGEAAARALWSPEAGLLLIARNLPALPDGKCYQVWTVRQGSPAIVSAGVLETDGTGRGLLYATPDELLSQATGFAITDEPAGGSVRAQGDKLLFGAF